MDHPRYLYRTASSRQRYPGWPVWYREQHPIKKYFRVLDCEDEYDDDDFYKVEFRIASDPAYTQWVSPTEKQRFIYLRMARLRAEAIVREIETYKRNAAWRKRLTRARNEFDFVWEPYRQALRKKYGWDWQWQRQQKIYLEEMRADLDRRRREVCEQEQQYQDLARQGAMFGGYGARERAYDLQRIKAGMKWIEAINNPYFTRIVVKLMDEQKDIRDQVDLLNRIDVAAHNGTLQPILEELNRKAGLYV